MELTRLQELVLWKARFILESKGINKICLDNLWSDKRIIPDFDVAVNAIVNDTLFWERG